MGSTSEKGILKTAKAGRRRWCTAVDLTCAKYKSTAVHHRRRPAFAVLSIPFLDVLPMYLLYFCKIQVNGRTPSTTACLRWLRALGATGWLARRLRVAGRPAGQRRSAEKSDLHTCFALPCSPLLSPKERGAAAAADVGWEDPHHHLRLSRGLRDYD
jgi:hypothetical protein